MPHAPNRPTRCRAEAMFGVARNRRAGSPTSRIYSSFLHPIQITTGERSGRRSCFPLVFKRCL
jgi:hypothetical protein